MMTNTTMVCNYCLSVLPGEGSGLESPPAGLLFWGYEGILGRAPRSGLAKRACVSVEFEMVNSTSCASVSDGNKKYISQVISKHFKFQPSSGN